MAKSRSRQLQEQSLEMALAAIETYNKPRFPAREHTIQILMCAAWESMIKARILATSSNRMSAIQIKESNGKYKRNRHGDRLTIGAAEGMRRLGLDLRVIDNYEALEKLRDASVHLPIPTEGHKQILFQFASASLKNYAVLSRHWYKINLRDIDWYILPLGFDFPFKRFTLLDYQDEPEIIRNLVKSLAERTPQSDDDDEFSLLCQLDVELRSIKKLVPDTIGATIGVDSDAEEQFAIKERDKLSQYRLEYREILSRLKKECPCVKQRQLDNLIRDQSVKQNPDFSNLVYTSYRHMLQGPKKDTKSVYSHEFLKFAIKELAGDQQCTDCPYLSEKGTN